MKVADIRYVQANGHVVTARVFDGDLRWKGSLAEAAARFEPAGFLRVHRAYLVNPERVVEVEPFFGGAYLLRVDDKARSEVPVSRNYLPACARRWVERIRTMQLCHAEPVEACAIGDARL